MTSEYPWTKNTAQQLVRYEALFNLLCDIQASEDIPEISRRIATQWKYFANVSSWRLTVLHGAGFMVIDGFRGEALISDVQALPAWDQYYLKEERPRLLRLADPQSEPRPPDHLMGKAIVEILLLPIMRSDRCIGLLTVSARHKSFSDLDNKFIRLFGNTFVERISDLLLRKQATQVLINRATHDALTGILNRGTIIDWLDSQLALSRRSRQSLSLIIVDIDFFKIINDSHGHLAGDEALCEVANRLKDQTRLGDKIGRYGGEEFVSVLYPCTKEEVAKVAERFRRTIADEPIQVGNNHQPGIKVTVSLGTSTYDGQGNVSGQSLLKLADTALYRSKACGRNCVTAATDKHS